MSRIDRAAGAAIERNPHSWIGRARFWAIAAAVVCLLAAGAVCVFVGWSVPQFSAELTFAAIFAAPAIVYLALASFLRRFNRLFCLLVAILAVLQAAGVILGAIVCANEDEFPWYLAIAVGVAAGLAILATAAFHAWLSRDVPDQRRGFEVLTSHTTRS